MSKTKYVIGAHNKGIFCRYTTPEGKDIYLESTRSFLDMCCTIISNGYSIKIKDGDVILDSGSECIVLKDYESIKHDGNLQVLKRDIEKTADKKGYVDISKKSRLPRKPNRKKSNEIAKKTLAFILTASLAVGALVAYASSVDNNKNEEKKSEIATDTIKDITASNIKYSRLARQIETIELKDIDVEGARKELELPLESETSLEPVDEVISETAFPKDADTGYLDFPDQSNTDKALYTRNTYYEIFEECAEDYGLDAELLLGIATQEQGYHTTEKKNGAIGIMQIQCGVWENEDVTYYKLNKTTGKFEKKTIHITLDMIKDEKMNIHLGAIITQLSMIYSDYNFPRGTQSYNQGYGAVNKIIKAYCNVTGKSYEEVKNNPEDLGWVDYCYLEDGDPNYLRNVNKWLPEHNFKITNVLTGEDVYYRYSNGKEKTIELY